MKKLKKLAAAALVLSLLAACSNSGSTPPANQAEPIPPVQDEPASLVIAASGMKPEEFDERYRKHLKEKFPKYEIEYIMTQTGSTIPDLITQGKVPDIIRIDIPTLRKDYLDLDLGFDLMPMIKTNKYDLNRFNQGFVKEIMDYTRDGKLYGLPVPPFFPNVLYYNKDLFDQAGVPYPKNGMTWDEVYELAKRMTRVDGDRVTRGMSMNLVGMLRDNPFSHPILDPEKDELSNSAQWKVIFDNLKRFYEIPNNSIAANATEEINAFGKGLSAMSANLHSVYLRIPDNINWDIVSLPTLEGAPKRISQRGPAYWTVTKTSKYKDAAFRVITEMLSDELQMKDSLQGMPTTLNKKEVLDALGKEHAVYKTKNMAAISFYPPTDPTPKRKMEFVDVAAGTQQAIILEAFMEVANGRKDVNTALREADEKLKKALEEEKSKQGKR